MSTSLHRFRTVSIAIRSMSRSMSLCNSVKAGVVGVTAACAATFYRVGIHEPVIQKILRHSHRSMTTSCYIKSAAEGVTEAMRQFE